MTGLTAFIRSVCCGGPVFGEPDLASLTASIHCARCGRVAGSPGVEDFADPETFESALGNSKGA